MPIRDDPTGVWIGVIGRIYIKNIVQAKLQIHDQNTPLMRPQFLSLFASLNLSLGKIDLIV